MNEKTKVCLILLIVSLIAAMLPDIFNVNEGFIVVIGFLGVFGAIISFIAALFGPPLSTNQDDEDE